MANHVDDNKYKIPYLTGNHTFADWVSWYNTLVVNKLNLLEVFTGASGDGIVFTLGTVDPSDPVGGATSGPDLPSGTFRCSIADVIPKGITFAGDVSIDGTLKYNLAQAENPSLTMKIYSDTGYTGTKGFTFGNPIRIATANPLSEPLAGLEGCTGDAVYYLGKADSLDNSEVFGIVSGVTWPVDGAGVPSGPYTTSNTWIEATTAGKIKGNFSYINDHSSGLTAGKVYFLSSGNSGGITPIEPTIAGQVSKPLLLGLTADEGVFLNYRGQFLKGSGTGGTGGIDNNRFIVSTTNADLKVGIVAQYVGRDGREWEVASSPSELSNAVGLIVNRFDLEGTTYIEIVTCGHVNNIPVYGGGDNGAASGLLYIDANGQLTNSNVSVSKPFAIAWPDNSGSGIRRGIIINQNSGGGQSSAQQSQDPISGAIAWAYKSTTSGGATFGAAINKNILINGDFDIWQRGIAKDAAHSATGTTYFADRWVRIDGVSGAGGIVGTYSLQRQEFAKNQTDVFGHPKYYISSSHAITGTGGHHGDRIVIQNRIEDVRTTNNEDVTLSFHAKSGRAGATMGIVVNQYDGTNSYVKTVARASVGSVWGKHEIAFRMPEITTTPTGKHYVGVGFDVTKMHDTTFDLAKVKLERGLVATTNSPSNEDDELKDCSRYYQRSYNVDENTHSVTMLDDDRPTETALDFTSTTMKDYYYKFPTRMREIPTVTFFSPSTGQTGDAYNRTAGKDLRHTSGTYGFSNATRVASAGAETINATHQTKDGIYIVVPSGSVLWDQISTHYVADAELNEDMPNSG